MGKYISDRFKNNPQAYELAKRIDSLGSWLVKDKIENEDGTVEEGLGMQGVIDEKLAPYKEDIPKSEIDKFTRAVEILGRTGKYSDQKLKNFIYSLKYKKLVYENGEWHFVNKLNTNWSDITDLIVDLFVRGGQIEKVSNINDLKSFLLKNKQYLSKLLNKYFTGEKEYFNYTINTKIKSAEGEVAEDKIEKFLIDNNFTILYRGGNGDFIDMVFGADIIVSHPKYGIKIIQVKKSGPLWKFLGNYNVDWVGIGDNLKIYDKITKEDITDSLKDSSQDDIVETFIKTGKI